MPACTGIGYYSKVGEKMVSKKMLDLGTKRSVIRDIFEYGSKLAKEIGAENVLDFSLGNPNVPAPDFIRDAAVDILMHGDPTEVHGYTIAPGKPAYKVYGGGAFTERVQQLYFISRRYRDKACGCKKFKQTIFYRL